MFRKILFPLIGCLIGVIIFSGCKQQRKFTIRGDFSIPDSTPVELYLLKEDRSVRVDSVYCREARFKIKGTLNYTQICLLKFFNGQLIYLVIRPGDHIRVSIDNSMHEISYYVENSPDSKRIKELIDKQNIVLRQIDQLSKEWVQNRADTTGRIQIDETYQKLLLNHRNFTRDFIYADPQSLANILALYQNFGRKSQPLFDRYDDQVVFNFVDSNLVATFPETYAVKALNREVTETKEQFAQKKYIEKNVVEGRLLPILKDIDVQGDTIRFDGTQKKPVLLFFWASWNPFSVKELISLQKFKSSVQANKIDIITISLDTSGEYLQRFINENQITLPVICDYAYWDSELAARYAIKQIPSSILANKDGFVVAKNIFSDELLTRINEITR